MREPSSPESKWAWWESAVAGRSPPIVEEEPHPGFYKLRRWPRLPYWLPVYVWIESPIDPETGELVDDERIRCEVDGKAANAKTRWTWFAHHPITEEEFQWLTALSPLLPSRKPK